MAGVYPTAGGQYHWTCVLAPKRYKRGPGYIPGFINIAACIINIASNCLIVDYLSI